MPRVARDAFMPPLPASPPPAEEAPPVHEEDVFEQKKGEAPVPDKPVESDPAAAKKKKLAEHLALCRAKSLAVRKAKAAEKKANKRPVGRPRKHPVKEPAPEPEPETPASLLPQPSVQPATPSVVQPPAPGFDYDRLAEMVAMKMQPPKAAAPVAAAPTPAAPANMQDMTSFLSAYSETVRQNERSKMAAEKDAAKKASMAQRTSAYYGRLPKPIAGNGWDSLFDPR